MEGYVKADCHRGIATLEFFHPKSNSLPLSLLKDLTQGLNAAAINDDAKVILLQSAGENTFCAGASFDELKKIQSEEEGLEFFCGFAHLINAMRTCPKFIVARVQGKCVGGGVGLAAAADFAVAGTNADIKLSELSIGIGPFVVGPAVERKMGTSAFTELAADARQWRNASWAHAKGLFHSVHEAPDTLEAKVYQLLEDLSHSGAQAMAELKKACWSGTGHWDQLLIERAAISSRLLQLPEAQEALGQLNSGVK